MINNLTQKAILVLTQTSQTHAENDVSLTQTTQTYTDFASRFALATIRMASTSAARAKVCEFCEFCVPNKKILARKILRKSAASA